MDIFIIRANALAMWMCLFTHTDDETNGRERERDSKAHLVFVMIWTGAKARKSTCLEREGMTLDIEESQFISLARCCFSNGEREREKKVTLSDPSGSWKRLTWPFRLLSFRCSFFFFFFYRWSPPWTTRWPSKRKVPWNRRSSTSLVHTNWSIISNRRFNWSTAANS